MIEMKIPGFGNLKLKYLVLDFNGTLALDGKLVSNVKSKLNALAKRTKVCVLTADTFESAKKELKGINCELHILKGSKIDVQKKDFVKRLGANNTICFGNGRNDRQMLKTAKVGIIVTGKEGYSTEAMCNADIGVTNIVDGLDLLLKPKRLIATLKVAER